MIHITFTEAASERLTKQLAGRPGEVKLVFDSEGCGCSANGVPTLWIVDRAEEKDLRAEGSPFELLYEKKHEIYFEDRMSLDYQSGSFVLKSTGQIYNANMQLIDKRQVEALN